MSLHIAPVSQAVGDALGSCVVNLVFLVVIDFLFRREPVWHRASQGRVLAGAFGVVMLGCFSDRADACCAPSAGSAWG